MQPGAEDIERELGRQRDLERAGGPADGLGRLHRRRLVPVTVDVAGYGVEHQRRVDDGAGQHAVDGDAVERLRQRPRRDAAPLRLDADQMRPGGGDPDAAGAVGADRRGDQTGRHGRRATTRRAARSVVARPRVSGMAEGGPTGERPLAQFAGVGLADDDRARGPQPAHDFGVHRRQPHPARRAEHRRLALDVDVVLDRDRNSQQRGLVSGGAPAVGPGGVGERLFRQHHPKRIECRLAGLDVIAATAEPVPRRSRSRWPADTAGWSGWAGWI